MHFIPDDVDDVDLDGASMLFQAPNLLSPANTVGQWLCQDQAGFHSCGTPTILNPTTIQSFETIKGSKC